MEIRNVYRSLKPHTPQYATILQIPYVAFPILACCEEISTVSRPAQWVNLSRVAFEFARNSICLHVKNYNRPINAPRCQEITFPIEAGTCCMTTSQTASRLFRIVLSENCSHSAKPRGFLSRRNLSMSFNKMNSTSTDFSWLQVQPDHTWDLGRSVLWRWREA